VSRAVSAGTEQAAFAWMPPFLNFAVTAFPHMGIFFMSWEFFSLTSFPNYEEIHVGGSPSLKNFNATATVRTKIRSNYENTPSSA
jgi:hypothetical protein